MQAMNLSQYTTLYIFYLFRCSLLSRFEENYSEPSVRNPVPTGKSDLVFGDQSS